MVARQANPATERRGREDDRAPRRARDPARDLAPPL